MISVIVPVYNGAAILPTTLPAFQALLGVDELIIVDDGSTDATADSLAEAEGVRTISVPQNGGRAAARNAGVAAATGDVLVFFDADVEPSPGAARALADAALAPGAVASVARLDPVPDAPGEPFQDYVANHPRGPDLASRPGERVEWRFFLSGACAVRLDAFVAAGGFPEAVAYGEDVALACRLSRAAPDGLRLAGATVRLHDLGDLDRALGHAATFGRAAAAIGDCDDGPLRSVRSAGWAGPLAAPAARVLGRVVAGLPPGTLRRKAVRYLLASTALASARRA